MTLSLLVKLFFIDIFLFCCVKASAWVFVISSVYSTAQGERQGEYFFLLPQFPAALNGLDMDSTAQTHCRRPRTRNVEKFTSNETRSIGRSLRLSLH
jgi:hypothetical protein